jgi:nucleotide-binding universal stress UspA family protein
MATLNRIVVAIDDSPASAAAIDEAVSLAADEASSVIFVHVASILGEQPVPGEEKPARALDHASSELLRHAADKARKAGVAVSTELLVGYPPTQIALLAEEVDADLIVIGSRHLTGLKRALLGSTSRALLTESRRRVLIVPYVPVEEPVAV